MNPGQAGFTDAPPQASETPPARVALLATGLDRLGDPLSEGQRRKLGALAAICPLTLLGYQRRGTAPPRLDGVRFVLARDDGTTLRRAARLSLLAVRTILALSDRERRLVVSAQTPYEGFAALVGRALARLAGRDVRVVVEAHGDWIEVGHLLERFPRWSGPLIRRFSRFVLSRADAIRTVSSFTADLVRPFSSAPVVTFPAYMDLDVFLEPVPAGTGRVHLLFAGVLTPVKGVDTLLAALAVLAREGRAVPLVLAGDGWARAALEAEVTRTGLDGLVSFRGHVDQRQLSNLMHTARALVLPSRSEGFGRVLVEAMACGTPVVASDVGGIREIVRDGHNGRLVRAGDVQGLADALRGLLADPVHERAMGARAREFVLDRFAPGSWAAAQRQLIALVGRAPGRRPPRFAAAPRPS